MNKIRGQVVYPPDIRLERLSVRDEVSGCVNWTGTTRNGYGRLMIGSRSEGNRRSVSAHRLSYLIHKGPIPDGMEICHVCDNRRCINPDHLFAGTRQDNVNDREAKGRGNYTRKLSNEDVLYIRNAKGKKTCKQLASEMGVTYWHIKDIWRGRSHPAPPDTQASLP